MRLAAKLHIEHEAENRRSNPRKRLTLIASASLSGIEPHDVTILDLSVTGILIQTNVALALGDVFQMELPSGDGVIATVIWNGGYLYGCQFDKTISQNVIDAALIRSQLFSTSRPVPAHHPESDEALLRTNPSDRNNLNPQEKVQAIIILAATLWVLIIVFLMM